MIQKLIDAVGTVVNWIISALWSVVEYVWNLAVDLWGWLWGKVVELFEAVWDAALWASNATGFQGWLESHGLAGGGAPEWFGYVDDVLWILPVEACLGIWFAAFGAAGFIRLLRWVLAMIPTIGG